MRQFGALTLAAFKHIKHVKISRRRKDMADIFDAYKFLNESLGLGLSDHELSVRERSFKIEFAKSKSHPEAEGFASGELDPEEFEFFAELRPAKK